MKPKEFDEIMSKPYSKDGWVVRPLAKPPIDKHINKFLENVRQSFLSNPGIPYCAECLVELEFDEEDRIYCPKCGLVIHETKKSS